VDELMSKDPLFNKWGWENWMFSHERMRLDFHLLPHKKIMSKWTKGLSAKTQNYKAIRRKHSSPMTVVWAKIFWVRMLSHR
jgi:hypothetical protein